MLTPEQLDYFEENGLVTVDTPFTSAQLDAAEAALDRLAGPLEPPAYRSSVAAYQDSGAPSPLTEPSIIQLFCHPFIESCSKSVLRAESVRFFQAAALVVHPQPPPFEQWDTGSLRAHIDVQVRSHQTVNAGNLRILSPLTLDDYCRPLCGTSRRRPDGWCS